jgi:hypothetical protein
VGRRCGLTIYITSQVGLKFEYAIALDAGAGQLDAERIADASRPKSVDGLPRLVKRY